MLNAVIQATLRLIFREGVFREGVFREEWAAVAVSDGIEALLGFTPDAFLADRVRLRDRFHPDDQDIADTLFGPDRAPAAGTFNCRLRQANGRIRLVRGEYSKTITDNGADGGVVILDLLLQDAKSLPRTLGDASMTANFRAMMENTDDFIYFKDRNHVFTGASQTLVSLCDPAEHWTDLLGQTDYDVFPEAFADIYYRLEKLVFAGLPVAHAVQETLTKDGVRGWVDNRKYPIRGEHGEVIGLYGIARDITERRRTELGLQRVSRLYATLSHCNQAIAHCTDEAALLQQVCHDAVVYGGLKMVWIGLLDPGDRFLKPVAWSGEGTAYLDGIRITIDGDDPRGRGPTGTAMRVDCPFWCQDFAHDPVTAPWHERGRRFGWAASAALPLHRGKVVVGALTIYAGEVGAFDAEARDLLVGMALDIDFALDRFVKDAERARMAEALSDSEEKYRELAESINDVIWKIDPKTERFLYISPSVFRLRGYTPDEIMAQPMSGALTPDSAARMHDLLVTELARFKAGQRRSEDVTVEEVEQPRKDGTTVWTEIVASFGLNRRTGRIEVRGVSRDISERKSAAAQIQRLAQFDQLTGLPNRSLLKDHFRFALNFAQRNGEPVAVMFLDLDHFKHINDTLGHEIGDRLLIEVARRLVGSLRDSDTLARFGGDEFILILPTTGFDGARQVASKLLGAVAQPYRIDQHELHATISIGIALYPEDGTDLDTLARNADAAMYQAKHDTRNDFCFFTRAMQERSARMLLLANALHEALERGEFSVLYQPQVALPAGRVVGAEALLRWQHPELGAIGPGEFIPIAESSGLILQIGEWVLRRAVDQAVRWLEQGLPPLTMAVNLSAVQFRHPNLPDLVARILDAAGLPAARLELELTEAVAMKDPQHAMRVIDRLAERGIGLALDDFGTGHSLLSYLKRFRVHKLKIDQSFVRDLGDDPDDKAITLAIINMAHSLGLKTIAEGVERADQLDFLRRHGCDEVQGYYYSRPLTSADFAAFMLRIGAVGQSQ
jgi:diguanylate cyclase (GGDEF)-like protein/PAS domain S-box-containing protein